MAMMATPALALSIAIASSLSPCAAFAPPTPATSTCLRTISPMPISQQYHVNNGLKDGRIISCSTDSININNQRRGEQGTALSMGIRSFIKRKILRRGERGGEGDAEDEADDVSLHSILQSPGSAGLMESPLDYDLIGTSKGRKSRRTLEEDDSSNYADDILSKNKEMEKAIYEDAQERISRMKGGGITEEEKMNFLNNALTGALPKQKPRGPPIRQKIPGMENADGDVRRGGASNSSSDESPKENFWNAITRTGGQTDKENISSDISVASLMMDGKMKNEEAKRRYMESITNPDRFATFSTYKKSVSAPEAQETQEAVEMEAGDESSDEEEALKIEGSVVAEEEKGVESSDGDMTDADVSTDYAQMKRQIVQDRELLNPNDGKEQKNAATEAVESILSMISSNNSKKAASSTGSDQSKKSTDHLAARLGQAAEEQEKRDAEARLLAEKEKEDEKERFAQIQRRREEEAQRIEMERIEKARKIAEKERRKEEERTAAERAELEARQAAQDEYWANMLKKEQDRKARSEPVEITRKKEVIARDNEERVERDVAKTVAREKIRNEERAREDPHEGEILKEAEEEKRRDRERVRDIEEQSAARVSRTMPKTTKGDVSASAFVREQQRKKEEIDRLRKLDVQSLKSLNSPLPTGPPVVAMPPPPPSPVPARSSSPDLSLASLTMGKKKEGGGTPSTPVSPPPAPPASQRLNLFEMTKLRQDADASKSSGATTPPKKKPPAKRVVRQQLPISAGSFDDDEDDDNLMRSGAPGLTVADALKQQRKNGGGGSKSGGKKDQSPDDKAKQWGIDMSKF